MANYLDWLNKQNSTQQTVSPLIQDYLSMGQYGNPSAPYMSNIPQQLGSGQYGLDNTNYSPGIAGEAKAIATPTIPMNGAITPESTGGSWWDSLVGTKDQPGWGQLAVGAGSGLMNAFMGMKQYGLAKDSFNENKRQFALNYDAQRASTNTRLADRQAARVAANPNAYQAVADYMKQNGIK